MNKITVYEIEVERNPDGTGSVRCIRIDKDGTRHNEGIVSTVSAEAYEFLENNAPKERWIDLNHPHLYWRAVKATIKFPLMWYVIFRMNPEERDVLYRFVSSFFEALQTVGFMWELAIRGFGAFKDR